MNANTQVAKMARFHTCKLSCLVCFVLVGWAKPEKPVQHHAAEDTNQQVQLWQLPLLGQLSAVHSAGAVPHPMTCRSEQRDARTHYHHPHPPPTFSSPLFKILAVVCKVYLCMYLYSIYVLVGYEMWFFCILFLKVFFFLFSLLTG